MDRTLRGLAVPAPRRAPEPFPRCTAAATLQEACDGVADDLVALGFELPSVYLLTGQRLRCRAARGYFQVVDGFRPGTGVIGVVVQSGEGALVEDVRDRPDFIAAVPGLVAEACAPVRLHGEVVGALSVESRSRLPVGTYELLVSACDALAAALVRTGTSTLPSSAQRLALTAVDITAARDPQDVRDLALSAAVDLSGMSTAALLALDPGAEQPRLIDVVGPLAPAVRDWRPEHLAVLASWVSADTSSHYPGGDTTPPGYEFLRVARAASVSVHPLVVAGAVTGHLVLAHDQPVSHAAEVVDTLDLLAAHTASALQASAVLAELSRRAERDELTDLGNRSTLSAAIGAALSEPGARVAVLLVDLDDFKHVNDHLGHQVGDRLLVAVAEVVRRSVREGDVACRLGGDEFAVVLPGADVDEATAVADRLLAALEGLAPVAGSIETTASVGIVVSDGRSTSSTALLAAADLAMYAAKAGGKGRWELFVPSLQQAAAERLRLSGDLRAALRSGEGLHLVFQPIVSLRTGALTGVEALCRWDHPVRGPVPPGQFVPLAEESGLVVGLGDRVLRSACAQLLAWRAAGLADGVRLSVNVSTRQLEDPALLVALDELLALGVDPDALLLEITETALAADADRAEAGLHAVRARGVALAVDDFGTGYSSLSRLGTSPIGRLKVDRSFVAQVGVAGGAAPIVDATLAMARGLGVDVVAEGVETVEQLAYLVARDCPEVQGYLLARPAAAAALEPLLRGERPWADDLARARSLASG